jgi:hypothetical protein
MPASKPGKGRTAKTKYPMATVIYYGPDDKTVTKAVVAVFRVRGGESTALKRWVATNLLINRPVRDEMLEFMRDHGVRTILTAKAVLGCPHEEGADYPKGEDCPFCPFWRGKQGSGTSDSRWDNLKEVEATYLKRGP